VDGDKLFMSVHVIADTPDKLSMLRSMLGGRRVITTELLGGASEPCNGSDAVIVTADLQLVENIAAMKAALEGLPHIRKRIFLIDQKGRLSERLHSPPCSTTPARTSSLHRGSRGAAHNLNGLAEPP
jgi:hypothetical protein